jgi:hypothetical protein
MDIIYIIKSTCFFYILWHYAVRTAVNGNHVLSLMNGAAVSFHERTRWPAFVYEVLDVVIVQ